MHSRRPALYRPIGLARLAAIAAIAALVVGFSLAAPAPAQERPGELSAEAWREDLAYVVERLESVHPDAYFRIAPEAFHAEVAKLRAEVPDLGTEQIVARMKRLVASLQDGHTAIDTSGPVVRFDRWFPVRIEEFAEGLFLTAVPKRNADLLGARVRKIGRLPAHEAWELAVGIAEGDNRMSRGYRATYVLAQARLLRGVEITDSIDRLALEVSTRDGQSLEVEIPSVRAPFGLMWFWITQGVPGEVESVHALEALGSANDLPLPNRRSKEFYWYEYLPDDETLYVKLNIFFDSGDFPLVGWSASHETFSAFVEAMWRELDERGARRLILDLRHNPGGNNRLLEPLINGILARPEINRRGRLFAITGRRTYSAAMNCVSLLEEHTEVLFAGEPAGGSPIHHGDNTGFRLPNSKMNLSISTYRWDIGSMPWDQQPMITPELPTVLTAEDFFAGRDPALERIAAFADEPALADRLLAEYEARGFDAAETLFAAHKEGHPDQAWSTSEADLREFAELLERRGDDRGAGAAFRLATEAYPESPQAWLMLGKHQMEQGSSGDARASFQTSLRLAPANRFARRLAEAMTKTKPPTVTDPRDGKVYKTVAIGSQTWLKENLRFDAGPDSRCFDGVAANCRQFGRLYTWPAAMRACPPGWRLPTEEDWRLLESTLGMKQEALDGLEYRGVDEGAKLRPGGSSGFDALFAGYMRPDGTPRRLNERTALWTATENQPGQTSWHRDISPNPRVYRSEVDHGYFLSVRCVADE